MYPLQVRWPPEGLAELAASAGASVTLRPRTSRFSPLAPDLASPAPLPDALAAEHTLDCEKRPGWQFSLCRKAVTKASRVLYPLLLSEHHGPVRPPAAARNKQNVLGKIWEVRNNTCSSAGTVFLLWLRSDALGASQGRAAQDIAQ